MNRSSKTTRNCLESGWVKWNWIAKHNTCLNDVWKVWQNRYKNVKAASTIRVRELYNTRYKWLHECSMKNGKIHLTKTLRIKMQPMKTIANRVEKKIKNRSAKSAKELVERSTIITVENYNTLRIKQTFHNQGHEKFFCKKRHNKCHCQYSLFHRLSRCLSRPKS